MRPFSAANAAYTRRKFSTIVKNFAKSEQDKNSKYVALVNRRQKYATFLLHRFETPHPRINDGAKPQGALIIEPGAGGFIIELGVRGIGKKSENGEVKKVATFCRA